MQQEMEVPPNFVRIVVAFDLNNGLLATGLSFWRSFYYDLHASVTDNVN